MAAPHKVPGLIRSFCRRVGHWAIASPCPVARGAGDTHRADGVENATGGTALDAGITLRDFYQLLCERGYVIAKLLPRALELRSYQPWMEHYAYANYVALAPDLLQTVKG